MHTWLASLTMGFLTALRFVALPSFAGLVLLSLGWRWKTRAWLPLWKLAVALLGLTALGTLGFAIAWQSAQGRL